MASGECRNDWLAGTAAEPSRDLILESMVAMDSWMDDNATRMASFTGLAVGSRAFAFLATWMLPDDRVTRTEVFFRFATASRWRNGKELWKPRAAQEKSDNSS